MRGRGNSIFGLIFALLICIAVSVGMYFWWSHARAELKASKSWPSVQGEIVRSDIKKRQEYDSEKKRYYYMYSPDISYAYVVNSNQYHGHRITFGDMATKSRKRVVRILKDYPVGKKVTVYYDPARPDRSVLVKKMGGGGYVVLIVGLMFGLLGITLILNLIKRIFLGR